MEFRLAKLCDNFPEQEVRINLEDFLTLEQFTEFQKSLATIEELNNRRRLVEFVEYNETDLRNHFETTLKDFLRKSASWNGIKKVDNAAAFLHANRLLLNYLSSIRTFLDHSEAFLKRKYADNSIYVAGYQKMTSVFFDNSFAYRFFYKLRNFAQHVGLPIDQVEFSSKYSPNRQINGSLKITFNRDELLSSYKEWGKVKTDLQSMNEEFEVMPLVSEMSHNIREIERNIELMLKEDLIIACNFIQDLTKHLQGDGEILVAQDFGENDYGDLLGYRYIQIPFETIEELIGHHQ